MYFAVTFVKNGNTGIANGNFTVFAKEL